MPDDRGGRQLSEPERRQNPKPQRPPGGKVGRVPEQEVAKCVRNQAMKFLALPLMGAYEITLQPHYDQRGYFARRFSKSTFDEHGLESHFVENSVSYSTHRGTVRGLHFQKAPFAETKLVRCSRGSAFDVIVDLRPDSQTFGRWHATEISCDNYRALYIPAGFAHGFQVLQDGTELDYQISVAFNPDALAGVRHDDPDLAIPWPLPVERLSERDLSLPFLSQMSDGLYAAIP
jgi:dTDP-4-dehydrorhamnose 3,5-epimerase